MGARHALPVDPTDHRVAAHPLAEIRGLPRRLVPEERLALDRELLLADESAATELLAMRQIARIARQ